MDHLRRISVATFAVSIFGAAIAAPPVPRKAPELTITDPSGKRISLASYAGKVVLVQFLFTTCPHCQETSRRYERLQNELGSRGLQVVGVAFNEEAEKNTALIRPYVESNGVTFPIGMAARESVLGYLGISVISRFVVPQVVVIDRGGTIRAQSDPLGSDELMDESRLGPFLQSLLDEHPAATMNKTRKADRTNRAAAK